MPHVRIVWRRTRRKSARIERERDAIGGSRCTFLKFPSRNLVGKFERFLDRLHVPIASRKHTRRTVRRATAANESTDVSRGSDKRPVNVVPYDETRACFSARPVFVRGRLSLHEKSTRGRVRRFELLLANQRAIGPYVAAEL